MLVLLGIGFLAGVITAVSPCILPVLPIVLAGGATGQGRRPFAIIAGGRPDQARELEAQGIPTYLHVPSPGLLRMFLKDGSMLIADDFNGAIYRLTYGNQKSAAVK